MPSLPTADQPFTFEFAEEKSCCCLADGVEHPASHHLDDRLVSFLFELGDLFAQSLAELPEDLGVHIVGVHAYAPSRAQRTQAGTSPGGIWARHHVSASPAWLRRGVSRWILSSA